MGLKLAYIGLTGITLLFLFKISFKAINATSLRPKKDKIIVITALLLWQLFIFIITTSGLLYTYEFPPRFAIAFILPSFLFTGIFLYRNRNKKWIKSIPEQWIIYFQSFRIVVELLFVLSLADKVFNPQVTIEGYNYDMVFALTAPIIGYLTFTKKIISKKTVYLWNWIGLCVLASVIFIFMTSVYKPEIYGSNSPILPLKAMSYPYVLIAGFLMPTAVFLHVLSIIQIKKTSNNYILADV